MSHTSVSSLNVLIVEDEPSLADMLARWASSGLSADEPSWTWETCNTVRAAMVMIDAARRRGRPYDVVLADWVLGDETAVQLFYVGTPVMIFTGRLVTDIENEDAYGPAVLSKIEMMTAGPQRFIGRIEGFVAAATAAATGKTTVVGGRA